MRRHFMVTVEIDPTGMESDREPDAVVADEIASNPSSVDYVKSCEVVPVTPPERGETHFSAPDPGSVAPLKYRPEGGRWIRQPSPDAPRKPGRKKGQTFGAQRPYSHTEEYTIEALHHIGLTDLFIALFVRRSECAVTAKRCRMGVFSFADEPRQPRFRLDAFAIALLRMLEPPDSRLWTCIEALPQFVTSYVDDAGSANDSR